MRKGQLILIVAFPLVNVEGMMEIEKSPSVNTIVIIVAGKNQKVLRLVG